MHTFLGELGQRADLGELLVALLLVERLERLLEEILVVREPRAFGDTVVVLYHRNTCSAQHLRVKPGACTYLSGEQAAGECGPDSRADLVLLVNGPACVVLSVHGLP